MSDALLAIGLTIFVVAFTAFMIAGLLQFQRDRKRGGTFSSGLAAGLSEFDRAIRPSVQHVQEVRHQDKKQEGDGAGDDPEGHRRLEQPRPPIA